MLLELKKIFLNDDESLSFSHEMDMSSVSVGEGFPFVSPVRAEGRVENHLGMVTLYAEIFFQYRAPCDRCAVETEKEFRFSFIHPITTNPEEAEEDETVLAENYSVELDSLLQADLLLELPMKYLCREECKGLCPSCGVNLNESECNCILHQVDPRLEVLKKLIN